MVPTGITCPFGPYFTKWVVPSSRSGPPVIYQVIQIAQNIAKAFKRNPIDIYSIHCFLNTEEVVSSIDYKKEFP